MNPLIAGALAAATEPSPNPTEGQLRPGLETWQVSPGLIGFVITFALALACVVLFLNMSKHLRQAGHNARQQGLPIEQPEGIGFRRTDGEPEFAGSEPGASPDAANNAPNNTAAGSAESPADGPASGERGGPGA